MMPSTIGSSSHVRPAAARRVASRQLALLSVRTLLNGVLASAAVSAVLSLWVLVGLGGTRYYTTPGGIRGYDPAHALLRPSGSAGLMFGILGALSMLVPFIYMLGKRLPRFRPSGRTLKTWLEIHIFCGIVGPVLVTYHTAFKFNGLVSVAYWSMILVALSGFVGRYLYVRIPRTIRGVEVSETELGARARELQEHLSWLVPPALLDRLEGFERDALGGDHLRPTVGRFLFGGWLLQRRLRILRAELSLSGAETEKLSEVVGLITERAQLVRRLAYLRFTKTLFEAWHVFHLPLVYVMFTIVSLHVALALYLGYGPLR